MNSYSFEKFIGGTVIAMAVIFTIAAKQDTPANIVPMVESTAPAQAGSLPTRTIDLFQ